MNTYTFGSVAFIRGITIVEENEYGVLPQGIDCGQVNQLKEKEWIQDLIIINSWVNSLSLGIL